MNMSTDTATAMGTDMDTAKPAPPSPPQHPPPSSAPAVADPFTPLLEQTWASFDEAESAVKEAAIVAGFAAVKRKSENWHRELGHYRRHVYECYKGAETHHTQTLGKRKRAAARDSCPWSAYLTYFVRDSKWRFGFTCAKLTGDRLDKHTHPMSDLPAGIPANRRFRRPLVLADIIALGSNPKLSSSDIVDFVKKRHPGVEIERKDVINMLAKQKKGPTPRSSRAVTEAKKAAAAIKVAAVERPEGQEPAIENEERPEKKDVAKAKAETETEAEAEAVKETEATVVDAEVAAAVAAEEDTGSKNRNNENTNIKNGDGDRTTSRATEWVYSLP